MNQYVPRNKRRNPTYHALFLVHYPTSPAQKVLVTQRVRDCERNNNKCPSEHSLKQMLFNLDKVLHEEQLEYSFAFMQYCPSPVPLAVPVIR
ncbi:hypothetical protein FKM82_024073 [Ascaphus truei]